MEEEQLKLIDNTKFMIGELSKMQELYYDTLLNELGSIEGEEDWFFDYVFNHTDDKSFSEYLENYGKSITDVYHE